MESIKGFEFVTFEQRNADEQASHCTVIPFTRNVFDPMDFTPVCLDRIRNRVRRRTTSGFELALSVLFTSGVQHYAEVPDGMSKMPAYVREFMKRVPEVWEDTKFIDGFPGKFVVLARKRDDRWYVAGINGEANEKSLTLDLSSLPGRAKGTLITDGGGDELFQRQPLNSTPEGKLDLTLRPNGGFVVEFE
jgi:hypothetical protein